MQREQKWLQIILHTLNKELWVRLKARQSVTHFQWKQWNVTERFDKLKSDISHAKYIYNKQS